MREDAWYVELTEVEAYFGAVVGLKRQITGVYTPHAEHRWNCDPNYGWKNNVLGAMAEYAVAKRLGVYWTGMFTRNVDIGADLEVRFSENNNASLITHDSDPKVRIFILVTGFPPAFYIQGWMRCADTLIRDKENRRVYWREMKRKDGSDASAYFVPQGKLSPMYDLFGEIP